MRGSCWGLWGCLGARRVLGLEGGIMASVPARRCGKRGRAWWLAGAGMHAYAVGACGGWYGRTYMGVDCEPNVTRDGQGGRSAWRAGQVGWRLADAEGA